MCYPTSLTDASSMLPTGNRCRSRIELFEIWDPESKGRTDCFDKSRIPPNHSKSNPNLILGSGIRNPEIIEETTVGALFWDGSLESILYSAYRNTVLYRLPVIKSRWCDVVMLVGIIFHVKHFVSSKPVLEHCRSCSHDFLECLCYISEGLSSNELAVLICSMKVSDCCGALKSKYQTVKQFSRWASNLYKKEWPTSV